MFKTFSRMPDVSVTGLLGEMGPGLTTGLRITELKNASEGLGHLSLSLFFAAISGNRVVWPLFRGHLGEMLLQARNFWRPIRTAKVPVEMYKDVIWRLYFEKSLEASDRALIFNQPFIFSNLSIRQILDRVRKPVFLGPKISTVGYNFFITSDSRPMRVSPGTRLIARYHDPIPILHPDTFPDDYAVKQHFWLAKHAVTRAHFVCNSIATEHEVVSIFPQLRGRTTTIPYALPEIDAAKIPKLNLHDVFRTRASAVTAPTRQTTREPFERGTADPAKAPRYIMGLSTLEPRKNFEGLIRAWERIKFRFDPQLKLVIVGRPGWRFEKTLDAIRPHVARGDLIHLQDLPFAEILLLYRQAECFVFPSFAEGFGFPPMEALQCGTPAIASDLPVHRWVGGGAVHYCDPYDVEDIAQKIWELVIDEKRELLRNRLLAAAPGVLSRFTIEKVAIQWRELFARLLRGDAPNSDI